MTLETQVLGQVTTSVRVNVRDGAPNTDAPVLRKLDAGVVIGVCAVAVGESVQGNANWYRTAVNSYVWSGGCWPPVPNNQPSDQAVSQMTSLISNLNRVPLVIDISHGDGVLDFADAKAAGLVAVIHKATTGGTGRDDAYKARRDAAREAGLLWGAYHWGTAADINLQVENFLDWAGPDDQTLVAVDFEETPGNQMSLQSLRDYCDAIYGRLTRRPVIYGGGLLKSYLGGGVDKVLATHRLWLAEYGPQPKPPSNWPWWLWQYTDGEDGPGCKAVPGITGDSRGRLDCDYFAGSAADLAAQWAV